MRDPMRRRAVPMRARGPRRDGIFPARILAIALAAGLAAGCTGVESSGEPPGGPSLGTGPATPGPTISGPTPIVIDTDLGADDTIAIPFLLREPGVSVLGITVVGTGLVHCAQGLQVLASLLATVGAVDIPTTCGSERPLAGTHEFPAEWRAAADAGYGLATDWTPVTMTTATAPQLLSTLAAGSTRPVTLVALGPLTNVAQALGDDPALAGRLERIVAMGGAVDVPGNVNLGQGVLPAEWNVYADPTATDIVLRWGVPVTLVALDATSRVPVTPDFFARLETDHAAAPADIAYEVLARGALTTVDEFWDPLAAVITVDERVGTFETIPLWVVTEEGPDSGRTRMSPSGVPVRVAISADATAFEQRLLEGLRTGPPRTHPFSPVGTLSVRFDGTTCADQRPATLAPGDWMIKAESTVQGTVAPVLVKFHDGYGWQDLVRYAKTAPDPTVQPSFVDVPWLSAFEKPGTSASIATLAAGTYAFACLTLNVAKPATTAASGAFTIAP